jgi:phospholipid/cholesterol/gamma-HCH transport system permease protein
MAGWTKQPAATIAQTDPGVFALSGDWTVYGLDRVEHELGVMLSRGHPGGAIVDGSMVAALDSAGGRVVQKLLQKLRQGGAEPQLRGWKPVFAKLIELGATAAAHPASPKAHRSALESIGRGVVEGAAQLYAGASFTGEVILALSRGLSHPASLRLRPILYNIQSAGTAALPIVGLLAFMLGIVVAYQGADQLQRYGANIFIVDLVGLSMAREFAPLITAIIVAGRSGSAYAAQIGAMKTSEEIDAMRTLGIAPIEMLVLPKFIALIVALPLLTVFADVLGVAGGMLMASTKLDVSFADFIDRLGGAVSVSSYLVGIGKAPVFAAIIALTGCFQGFRAEGGADSVGRQTTRSVVQSIFLVIVADALFSVLFSVLHL